MWKNRNAFIFEGKPFEAEDIVRKAKEKADAWFLAQKVHNGMEIAESEVVKVPISDCDWFAQPGWVSCEFDMDWVSEAEDMGAAWIVKNERGRVLHHSRRAFVKVKTREEAKLQVWLWVVESIKSLKKKKVVFISTFDDIVEAINKPALRPALQFEASEINRELKDFEAWELRIGVVATVRCASFIAQSVRRMGFYQSYVAAGHPRWLDHMYASERVASNS